MGMGGGLGLKGLLAPCLLGVDEVVEELADEEVEGADAGDSGG